MSLQQTGSQTVGPFFRMGLDGLNNDNLAPAGVEGVRITIHGRVFDGDGKPVPDAMLELWQANHLGKYADRQDARHIAVEAAFTGFGRVPTDPNGAFRFSTIKPGVVPAPDGTVQAPHIVVLVFMRGLLKHLMTRIYFPGDEAHATDGVLSSIPAERRATLVAVAEGEGSLRFDVHLQGRDETVFFDY